MKIYEYAIGDVHGHIEQLELMLTAIDEHAKKNNVKARCIFLGDLVDRGPGSKQVVDRVRGLVAEGNIALLGNHEDMMIDASKDFEVLMNQGVMTSNFRFWWDQGGKETANSYSGLDYTTDPRIDELFKDVEWFESLPLAVHNGRGRVYVHAGLMPGFGLKEQPREAMLWIRDRFFQAHKSNFPGVEYVVHGHTPTNEFHKPVAEKIQITSFACNCDTGVFFSGVLGCAVFSDDQLEPIDTIYVSGRSSRPKLKVVNGLWVPDTT